MPAPSDEDFDAFAAEMWFTADEEMIGKASAQFAVVPRAPRFWSWRKTKTTVRASSPAERLLQISVAQLSADHDTQLFACDPCAQSERPRARGSGRLGSSA